MSEDNRFPNGSGYNPYTPYPQSNPYDRQIPYAPSMDKPRDTVVPVDAASAPIHHKEESAQPTGTPGVFAKDVKSTIPDEDVEEDPSFTYKGMQIVRGEYFTHMNEPAVTFVNSQIYVNTACIKKAPNVEYIQVLINPDEKKMAIRPSTEDVKDSFSWKTKRGAPKHVGCPILFAMLVDLLGWDPECRYKIIGKRIKSEGEYLFSFILDNRQMFKPTNYIDENGEERRKATRTPIYNDDWKNQFGLPVDEHQRAFQVNIFDGYAVFGIKSTKKKAAAEQENSQKEE